MAKKKPCGACSASSYIRVSREERVKGESEGEGG